MLDEPTRNFSPLSGPVIRQLLKEFPGVIISISHDRKYISEVCDKVYRLTENGLKDMAFTYTDPRQLSRLSVPSASQQPPTTMTGENICRK